jgi:hypothetical protein
VQEVSDIDGRFHGEQRHLHAPQGGKKDVSAAPRTESTRASKRCWRATYPAVDDLALMLQQVHEPQHVRRGRRHVRNQPGSVVGNRDVAGKRAVARGRIAQLGMIHASSTRRVARSQQLQRQPLVSCFPPSLLEVELDWGFEGHVSPPMPYSSPCPTACRACPRW